MTSTSGFDGHGRPETTNWEEHGAQGDVSTGRKFKKVQKVPNILYIDEASSTITYIGDSKPGTATSSNLWRIKKIEVSGTVTSILFPNGDDGFNYSWNNRATFNYS